MGYIFFFYMHFKTLKYNCFKKLKKNEKVKK